MVLLLVADDDGGHDTQPGITYIWPARALYELFFEWFMTAPLRLRARA